MFPLLLCGKGRHLAPESLGLIVLVVLCLYVSCCLQLCGLELLAGQNLESAGRQAPGYSSGVILVTLIEMGRLAHCGIPFSGWDPEIRQIEKRKWAEACIRSFLCPVLDVLWLSRCFKLLLPSFSWEDGPHLEPRAKVNPFSHKLFLSEYLITTSGNMTQTSYDCTVLHLWLQASPWRYTGWVNNQQDVQPCLLQMMLSPWVTSNATQIRTKVNSPRHRRSLTILTIQIFGSWIYFRGE